MRAWIVIAVALAGCLDAGPGGAGPTTDLVVDPAAEAHAAALADLPVLRWDTSQGLIEAVLYTEHVPASAGHVADLAASGFYDGTIIHRVVDGFVVQGGDPTGTGEGGSGTLLPPESHPDLDFGIGSIGLAQWVPRTADSQWFFVEYPQPHLKDGSGAATDILGPYPMIGQVVAGMDVVRDISGVETLPNDRPVEDVDVASITVTTAAEAGVDLWALPQVLHAWDDAWVQAPAMLWHDHLATILVVDRPGAWLEHAGARIEATAIDDRVAAITFTPIMGEPAAVIDEGGRIELAPISGPVGNAGTLAH